MSWGTCYSGSNNIHASYPPLMSDGRIYTDYKTNCNSNNNINSNEYRDFMISNATMIMNENTNKAWNDCGNCNITRNKHTNHTKYFFKSCNDFSQPYGYESSNLKNMYLSREALQSRMIAPMIDQDKLLQFQRAK